MFKKLLAGLLAVMMLFSLTTVAMADEPPTIDEDTSLRVHYWFNGDLLDTQRDLKHAINGGGATFVQDDQFGTVLSLPGGDGNTGTGYLSIPGDAFQGSSPAESMTVSAWIYQQSRNWYARMFDFGQNTTKNFWYMPYSGARAAITVGGSGAETQATGNGVANREWHHVAVSLDAQNKTLTYFLDGVQVSSRTCNISFSDIQNDDPAKNKFYIGKSQYGDALFNGRMFDFRVYDVAKNATEVTAIMNEALTDDIKLSGDLNSINLGSTTNRTTDVTLPTEGKSGSTFTWESSNNDIINAETGELTRPVYTNANETETVVLTVTGTNGEFTDTKEFTFTVPRMPSPAEVVANDLAALDLGDLSALTESITLPTEGKLGATITWATTNDALAADGTVTRPASTEEHATGTLTATLSYQTTDEDKVTDTKTFDFKVIRLPSDQDYCDNDAAALNIGALESREENFDLPAAGASEVTTITWASSDTEWISNDGVVTRPKADYAEETVTVTLTATITKGDAKATKDFVVTIDRRPMDLVLVSVSDITATTEAGYLPKLPYYIPGNYVDGMGNEVTGPAVRVNWYGYQNAAGSTSYSSNPATSATAFANVGDVIEVRGRVPELSSTGYVTAYVTVVEATEKEGPVKIAKDYHLSQVSLNKYENGNDTVFRSHQYKFIDKLTNVASADSFLYMFRYTFGEDSPKGSALGGWDNAGTLLRGHATGHYLSAISQAYADTTYDEDQTLHNKLAETIDYVVGELYTMSKMSSGDPAAVTANPAGSIIQGSSRRKDFENWGVGFISAYPPDQFVMLENGAGYGSSPSGIWAPYYTLHKILAGLIACYLNTGNEQALEIATGMGIWVQTRLKNLPEATLYSMWNRYIAGEYGGMNEVMATLYEITEDERFMEGAKLFDNTAFFFGADKKSGLANNVDTIRGRHANQHTPQILGALKIYEITGEVKYWDVANNFMDMVLNSYNYAIGGVAGNNSNVECFTAQPNTIASTLHDSNNNMCETCATYNMLKLARQFFMFTGDAQYMDYYERAWYNQIAASVNDNCGNTYHIPLDGGSSKSYGNHNLNGFTCCNGTAIESNTKLQDSIYFRSLDDSAVYVNLYAPSTLHMESGVVLTQVTNFPYADTVKIEVSGNGEFDLMARIPYWATNGYNVKVNGEELDIIPVPSSYVCLGEEWNDGDIIEIEIPMALHILKTMDKANVGSVFYGPILLAGSESRSLSALREISLNGQELSKSITVDPETLTATVEGEDFTMKPFYDYTSGRYSVYYNINYLSDTFKNVDYTNLEKAIAKAEALVGDDTADLTAAVEAGKALVENKGVIQADVNEAAEAIVVAMHDLGVGADVKPETGIVSVNGSSADEAVYVAKNEAVTVKLTVPEGAVKIGYFNEVGKGISSKSVLEDGVWTSTFSIGTKGERVISVFANYGEGWVDTGLKINLSVGNAKPAETADAKVISAEVISETVASKQAFQYQVVTSAGVDKVGIFNENGAGISKTTVSKEVVGDTIVWTFSSVVNTKGSRTLTAKVIGIDGEWVAEGVDFAVRVK